MAIELVGITTHNTGGIQGKTIDLTSLTGGLDTQPSTGDVVVVTFAGGSNADRTLSATGYTQIAQQRPNDTYDVNHYCGYKVMGATPDTSVTLTATNSSSHGAVVIVEVWRGVDTTTPLDVTSQLAQSLNSALANPDAITPVTSGAKICVSAACAHVEGTVDLASSDLGGVTAIHADATIDVSALRGSVDWTSGAFDPAAMTFGGSDSTQYSWATATFALRPASGGGVTGDAAGSQPLSGTAAGAVGVDGDGAGSQPMGGAATGSVEAQGDASGSMPMSGGADGTVGSTPISGDAAGSMTLGGASDGSVDVQGHAAGAAPLSGASDGGVDVQADAAGSMPLSGGADGTVGSVPIIGDAAGDMPMGGAASGSVDTRGDAAGAMPISGTGGGSVDVDGDATGVMPLWGSGDGGVADPPTINFIIMAANNPPRFRTIGGNGGARAVGGQGSFRAIGGGQ